MSYSMLKAIYPGDRVEDLLEMRNSYGTAPYVWAAVADRYLGVKEAYSYPGKGWMQLACEGDTLWNLWKRQDIPEEHRAVFMFTFDRLYVAREDYPRMAAAIERFLADFPNPVGYVNHWSLIANIFKTNTAIPGIGLHCTSVSEDPFEGKWNKEKEDYDPLDWATVFDIYGQLATLGK